MTIATEITRIKTNIENAYTKAEEKGATIPTVKNSENLAACIETVSTGGGGVEQEVRGLWTVPTAYTQFDKIMEDDSKTADYPYSFGYVFDDRVVNITWSLGNDIKALRTTDGAYYDISEYGTNSITHTWDNTKDLDDGHRGIIIYTTVNKSNPNFSATVNNGTSSSTKLHKYCVFNMDMELFGNFSPTISASNARCESFKIINEHKVEKISAGSFWVLQQDGGPVCKYVPSMEEMGNPIFTATSLSWNSYYATPNLPYGLDLSTVTSNVTFGRAPYTLTANLQAYVTIPAVNITMHSYSGLWATFSKDNWDYIAQHAPTVTDKTIKMGSQNIAICGGMDGEIIQTFISKGWTVT